MIIPLIILAIGALLAGYFFKDLLIGNNSTFWNESILFLNFVKLENIPIWLILITPTIITLAIPLSYFLYIKDKTILDGVKNSNLPLYTLACSPKAQQTVIILLLSNISVQFSVPTIAGTPNSLATIAA